MFIPTTGIIRGVSGHRKVIFPRKTSVKSLMTIIERALNRMGLFFVAFGAKQLDLCEVGLGLRAGFSENKSLYTE